ncbi:MAG: GIY-YIG nuclease family protein [Methanoregula sp.]|jgi:Uri superfamily endonuclease|uniref:GIY-YIG nuclease family protein n=1 Tax=Methanoregula sp. TaxID=2052170 RepID=UPI003D0E8489
MDKGIYCLVFENPGCTLCVGALGPVAFAPGWHIYVGSALGSGGLKRLARHIAFSEARDRIPTWHVDYLLTSDFFSLRYAVYAITRKNLECPLARAVGDPGVPGFGCSDCHCLSHLFHRHTDPALEVLTAFQGLGLAPVTKTIMSLQCSKGNI